MPQLPANSARSAWIIGNERSPDVQVWALSTSERHRRLLVRAGCETIRRLDANETPGDPQTPSVIIVRSDAILDERLVEGLFAAQNTILVADRAKNAGWGGAVAAHVDSAHAAETLRDPADPAAIAAHWSSSQAAASGPIRGASHWRRSSAGSDMKKPFSQTPSRKTTKQPNSWRKRDG